MGNKSRKLLGASPTNKNEKLYISVGFFSPAEMSEKYRQVYDNQPVATRT